MEDIKKAEYQIEVKFSELIIRLYKEGLKTQNTSTINSLGNLAKIIKEQYPDNADINKVLNKFLSEKGSAKKEIPWPKENLYTDMTTLLTLEDANQLMFLKRILVYLLGIDDMESLPGFNQGLVKFKKFVGENSEKLKTKIGGGQQKVLEEILKMN